MATEVFTATHDAGLTVYFRFVRPVDGEAFDFDTNEWVASVAAAVNQKLSATESTDFGDDNLSVYKASLNLALLNPAATSMGIIVQTCDDATDEVLGEKDFWIVAGADIRGIPDILAFAASVMIDGAVTAGPPLAADEFTTDVVLSGVDATVDRVMYMRDGINEGQVAEVSAYDGSGKFTFEDPGFTQAPEEGDLFVLV